jgi:hypothetical protein
VSAVATAVDAPIAQPVTIPEAYKAEGQQAAKDAKAEKQVTNTLLGIAHWSIEALLAAAAVAIPGLGVVIAQSRATIGSLIKAGEAMKCELDTDVDGKPDPELKERRKVVLNNALDSADIKRIQAARRKRGEHT